jgi:UDP-N-acetylglucosamine:LPS N-acetylglucosamine transferase
MVSKPGGGTMLDSIWSATPLVLLEPFGEHEARNAELWERLGFGISVDRWRDTGFAVEVLEEIHDNLLRAKPGIPDYAGKLAEEICQ